MGSPLAAQRVALQKGESMNSGVTTSTAIALCVFLLLAAAMALVVRKLFAAHREPEALPADELLPMSLPPAPRCICGEIATEPMPHLERGRGSVLRDLFAMPPRYRRVVRREAPAVLCPSHGHVADAELAAFVAIEVRAAFQRAYAQVAARVATYEQEELVKRIEASMSDSQRKAGRRVASLRPLPRSGTED